MRNTTFIINSKNNISQQNFEIPKTTKTQPDVNEWMINDRNEIYINSGAGKFGALSKFINGLNIGDIITVSAEVYCFSGEFPKLAIDNQNSVNQTSASIFEENRKFNTWIPIQIKYVCISKETRFKVLCGVWTNDVSYFAIRNMTIDIESTSDVRNISEKNFVIAKLNGALQNLTDYSHETIVFESVNDYSIRGIFDTALVGNKKPINFYSNDAANNVTLGITSVDVWSFILRAKDIKTGELIKINDIPDGNYVSVCLKQIC